MPQLTEGLTDRRDEHMPTLPSQSYLAWKISLSVLHALAIASGIYRLVHRFRVRKAGWDDYLVCIPVVLDIACIILFWFRFPAPPNIGQMPSQLQQVLDSFWLSLAPYLAIIWSTRAVLALSMVRIFPPKHRARQISFILTYLMGGAWIATVVVTAFTCKRPSTPSLMAIETKMCLKSTGKFPVTNIFLFVVDFVGDILLIVAPLIFFWKIKLPRAERRLILTVSCASFLTLLSAIVFAALTVGDLSLGNDSTLIISGMASIEAGTSLLVCNLAVVTTCLYQFITIRTSTISSSDTTLQTGASTDQRGQQDSNTQRYRTRTNTSQHFLSTTDLVSTPLNLTEISDFSLLSRSDSSLSSKSSEARSNFESLPSSGRQHAEHAENTRVTSPTRLHLPL
ncbi:hypothetical protein B0H34DRAFT_387015 [Crassisporium funariophilum]|nr:hypothetical protein B0H34DRAFT_387015 [Crassisporium funariophilum]